MASIRKRNGKFQARVTRQGYPSVARTFLTRLDAVRWARQTEVEIERNAVCPQPTKTTLRQLIDRYITEVTPRKKNARAERYVLTAWASWESACQAADRVRPLDIARWRDDKLKAGVATGTIRNALAALSAVYRHAALDWGYDALVNPVMRLKRPPPGRARSRRVSAAEIAAIKAATESQELPALLDLAVETAMRLSEIVTLTWQHVDLTARTVHLPDTKNGEPRTVPLTTTAARVLNEMRHGRVVRIDGRVFGCSPHAVTVAFRRAVARALRRRVESSSAIQTDSKFLVDLRFHDLRHEAISRLFECGLNPIEVATISGHRNLQMLKRYTHLKAADLVRKIG